MGWLFFAPTPMLVDGIKAQPERISRHLVFLGSLNP